mmetsp:Transcript_27760/g.38366  ORF Transcript_27760/g.38366 Transcript_27760/m.38366 type:complete len:180 (+) Transcript_27760:126-665(+)
MSKLSLSLDVLLSRPISFSTLVPSGRALFQHDPMNQRSSWWSSAARALGGVPSCTPATLQGGVTPAILSTNISRALLYHLEKVHPGKSWDAALFSLLDSGADWTEYSLYWTFACFSGLHSKFHTPVSSPQLYTGPFGFGMWRNWKAKNAFRNTDSVFTVVQSIGGSDPHWLLKEVLPEL